MKKILAVACLQLILITSTQAQSQYEISFDKSRNNVKVLKGIINKYLVMNDSAFSWYNSSQKDYKVADNRMLDIFEKAKNQVQYVVFGGTWCEDTRFIVPKFFKLQEMSGVPDDRITFIGVDGNKKTLGNLTEAMNITNVPTIIIMKNGKELGRVVEYGKTGSWDKELSEIVAGSK